MGRSSTARGLHDDRCLRQLFIPCQVIEEIADSGTTAVQNGPLVLATQTGLVRFDGVPFQQFAPVTVPGVPPSILDAALVDRRGRLWVAKEEGTLVCMDQGRATVLTRDNGLPAFVA